MIFTVGHSTLDEGKFVYLLQRYGVQTLMDVRSHPTSKWSQYWREEMQKYLPAAGIGYVWEPGLGGWQKRHVGVWGDRLKPYGVDLEPYGHGKFPKQAIAPEIPPDPERPTWTNLGLQVYSFFTAIPEFQAAGRALIERGHKENVAICCAEGAWFRCHRSQIADWLVWAGSDCQHIAGRRLHSEVIGDRLERYHPDIIAAWQQGGMQ